MSAKMSKIAILRKWLVFKNFDLLHINSSSLVIFGPVHLISFAFGHRQTILDVGWEPMEWSPWCVAKFWIRIESLRFWDSEIFYPLDCEGPWLWPEKNFNPPFILFLTNPPALPVRPQPPTPKWTSIGGSLIFSFGISPFHYQKEISMWGICK